MSNMRRNREGAKSETRGPYFKVLDKIEKIAYDDIQAEIDEIIFYVLLQIHQ